MKKRLIGTGISLLLLTGCVTGTEPTEDISASTTSYESGEKERADRLDNISAEQENNPNTMSTTVYDKEVETWSNAMTEGLSDITYYAELSATDSSGHYEQLTVRTMEYLTSYINNFQNIRIGEDYPAERTEVHLHVTAANVSYVTAFDNYTEGIRYQDPELIDQGDFFLALAEENLYKAIDSYEQR